MASPKSRFSSRLVFLAKWGGPIVLMAWLASGWGGILLTSGRSCLGVEHGNMVFGKQPTFTWFDLEVTFPAQFRLDDPLVMFSGCFGGPQRTVYHHQLAWYVVPFAIVSLYIWLTGIGVPSPRSGVCASCAYNLTGNVSGVCPECGPSIEQAPPKD